MICVCYSSRSRTLEHDECSQIPDGRLTFPYLSQRHHTYELESKVKAVGHVQDGLEDSDQEHEAALGPDVLERSSAFAEQNCRATVGHQLSQTIDNTVTKVGLGRVTWRISEVSLSKMILTPRSIFGQPSSTI
jgi:hypothetical protein